MRTLILIVIWLVAAVVSVGLFLLVLALIAGAVTGGNVRPEPIHLGLCLLAGIAAATGSVVWVKRRFAYFRPTA